METPADTTHESDFAFDTTGHPKADLLKRFVAHLLDGIIAGLGSAVVGLILPALGGIVGAAYFLVRDGLELEFMNRRSIGKSIMKLRPIKLDGTPMDVEASFRRNWMFALGGLAYGVSSFEWFVSILSLVGTAILFYEVYKVFTDPEGRRWGDELAGTQVIESIA